MLLNIWDGRQLIQKLSPQTGDCLSHDLIKVQGQSFKIFLMMSRLRPKSAEACITGASFFKFSLPVPQELQVCALSS